MKQEEMQITAAKAVIARYEAARARRGAWMKLWQECYEYALPQNAGFTATLLPGAARTTRVYDATAMDAADQLAASMLGHLTPPWSQWFGLKTGPDMNAEQSQALAPLLEQTAKTIQMHFDHSNFAVEIHQCYLDLVVGGTACLAFEEAEPGSFSAFRFSALPLSQVVLEEGAQGGIDTAYRLSAQSVEEIMARYPLAILPRDVAQAGARDPQARFDVLEAVSPKGAGYGYMVLLLITGGAPVVLQEGVFTQSPMIGFRWMKSPGEVYGRSPVMKALPDIKTANKVVELILKNASIAVTGIWQADDDGVLNPANIELVPGSIIPKAVGSKGLQPLEMPGRFDVSQIMLESLQGRVRRALLADKLLPPSGTRMTATEVIERAAEVSLLLGATYGRLQSELLTPLLKRAYSILRRRGEVPDLPLDGRIVRVDYRAPLARAQGQKDIQNTLSWMNSVAALGPEGARMIDARAAVAYLGEALAVPQGLMRADVMEGQDV